MLMLLSSVRQVTVRPSQIGGLADFFFHCDSFSFTQSPPRECTPSFDQNEAGESRSASQI